MLYDSARNVSFADVSKIPVPKRKDTSWWQGVPHKEIIQNIRNCAKQRKMKILNEQFQLGNKGHSLWASWDFDKPVPGVPGMKMGCGYRGSNVSRFAHTLLVGGRIVLCQNGFCSGEFVFGHKHSKFLDLSGMFGDAFDQYLDESKNIKTIVNRLRAERISDQRAHEMMFRSVNEGLIASSRIMEVHEHWHNSPHKDFQKKNAWTLYNAYTQACKKQPPSHQVETMRNLQNFVLPEKKS